MIQVPVFHTMLFADRVTGGDDGLLLFSRWAQWKLQRGSRWLADEQFLAALVWTNTTDRHGVQTYTFYVQFDSLDRYALFKLWYADFHALDPHDSHYSVSEPSDRLRHLSRY
jgi:hypothetical protein